MPRNSKWLIPVANEVCVGTSISDGICAPYAASVCHVIYRYTYMHVYKRMCTYIFTHTHIACIEYIALPLLMLMLMPMQAAAEYLPGGYKVLISLLYFQEDILYKFLRDSEKCQLILSFNTSACSLNFNWLNFLLEWETVYQNYLPQNLTSCFTVSVLIRILIVNYEKFCKSSETYEVFFNYMYCSKFSE